MGLAREAAKSGGWIGMSNILITILQLVQFSLLARFLAPADFGLISLLMTAFFLGVSTINAGFGNGIIAIPNVTIRQHSSLYWLNMIVGAGTFVLIYGASPLLSSLFHAPSLIAPLKVFSIIFLLIPLGQQFEYLLQKDLQFRLVSLVDLASSVIEAGTCVWLAYRGLGVYAFVWGKICYFGFRSLTFFCIGIRDRRPQFILSLREIRPFINFGVYQLGANGMFVLYSQMPKFIIAPLLGLDMMGYYELADRITMQPLLKILPVMKKVAFPVIAKVQNDLDRVFKGYRYYLLSLEIIMSPITLIIALFSASIVNLIFGKEWAAIVPYVKILSVATFVRCMNETAAALALATRRSDLDFYRSVFIVMVSFLCIYGGARFFGTIGVVWAVLASNIATLFFGYFAIVKKLLNLGSVGEFSKNAFVLMFVSLLIMISRPLPGVFPAICILLVYMAVYYKIRTQDIKTLLAQFAHP
jgi:O-antigen/teichoic acid export membrane protein